MKRATPGFHRRSGSARVGSDVVAVTGGGGFIGHALTIDQALHGRRVRSMDLAHPRPLPGDLEDAVGRQLASVLDRGALASAFAGARRVFHLASAHLEVRRGASHYRRVNVEGTRNVVEVAAECGVQRIVHVSTVGVYGRMTGESLSEASPTAPTIAYERTKLEGEGVARETADRLGVDLVIVRPSWVFGPGCGRTQKLFDAVRRGRFLMVGSGTARRDSIYIDDCLAGLDLCARHPAAAGETFILGSGNAPTLDELVTAVAEAHGVRPPRLRVPVAPMWLLGLGLEVAFGLVGKETPFSRRSLKFFTNATVFDTSRIQGVLGFRARVPWREGIRRTAAALASG